MDKLNTTVESLFKGMESFVSTKTVVGEPTQVGDTIIVPLADVSFGIAAGAVSEANKNNGMGGMGGKVTPSAVLVIKNDSTRLINIKNQEFKEGGSTITQQVAKNVVLSQERSWIRKIAEIFAAYDLEKNYTKKEIFELYVNTSYFGDGYYGIYEASQGYYKKEPKDLNLDESSMLAGVPNAPSVYAPTVNPDLAKKRQYHVINKMLEYGYITKDEALSIK